MSSTLADRFRRWFEYEQFAHDRVFDSLDSVPPERREDAEYRKAVDLAAHLVAARGIWLSRLAGGPLPAGGVHPQDLRLDDVRSQWRETTERWKDYLQGLDDESLAREVEYKTFDGRAWVNAAEDLLTQLFTHSPYHRGQIAMLVRKAGGTPAETDFIHWLRA